MAFAAAGFRFFRFHPHSLSFPLTAPARVLLARRISELRFLSSAAPCHQRRLFAIQASTKRGGEEIDENGSAISVRDGGGSAGDGGDNRVVVTELHKEATEAYIAYAMSVLLGRALPDVRDGLKPVHRRILYAMHELGLSSRKPYKKCARVVGEVLGKFHPHGDSAVYDSLVRMAQSHYVLATKRRSSKMSVTPTTTQSSSQALFWQGECLSSVPPFQKSKVIPAS